MVDIVRAWDTQVLVADGAMGTLLFARSPVATSCVESLNLIAPDIVEHAHRDYLEAGARVIETNSYAANRLKLALHELRPRLADINRAAVAIARSAAGPNAFIAASVGPLGAPLWPLGLTKHDEARDVFAEHVAALADASPDLLLLETFGGVAELELAIKAAREVAPSIPLVASLSLAEDGRSIAGDPLDSAFARLIDAGANGVGLNCAVGPHIIYDALTAIADRITYPLSVMPNAGYPHRQDDRAVYGSPPEYFARYARRFADLGARMIGGCCGTTPAHIRAIAESLADFRPNKSSKAQSQSHARLSTPAALSPVADAPVTAFERDLGRRFIITAEISPPRGTDARDAVAAAKLLERAGAAAVHIPDNPTARLRMSSAALAHLVMRETKLATILHLGCRDRNLLGLQSELLGASALGVSAILPLTGDPGNAGDFPKATSVFDVTALGLTQIVGALNRGEDHAGNAIGSTTRFRVGVAVNPRAKPFAAELERVESKLEAGAEFAVTQPVFEVEALQDILRWARERGVPVLPGVVLLRDYDNAEFLHNEVPGMHIPEAMRKRLHEATDQSAEAIALAQELIDELIATPGVFGVYLMPQDRYEQAAAVVARAARTLEGRITRGASAP
ncbi:MAG TPA: bifunctional homocysteine S-methyltransferase/methylenetetrahydrofolate reductase [Candidatus Acidoferrales bacterium]|nr:bifunctional homocysteine S-methyltransferase/methylenetetrahydrofolate reductase [Candidatus Acidoferrales bacterium]